MDQLACEQKNIRRLEINEIAPDNLFCYIRLLQGHPKPPVFRGVSEGSETVWLEGFHRGPETCG